MIHNTCFRRFGYYANLFNVMVCLTVFIITDSFACSMSEYIADYRSKSASIIHFTATPTGQQIDVSKNTYDFFSSYYEEPVIESIEEILGQVQGTFEAVIRGQLLTSFVQSFVAGITYYFLGIPGYLF